jgi:hypothetical protein
VVLARGVERHQAGDHLVAVALPEVVEHVRRAVEGGEGAARDARPRDTVSRHDLSFPFIFLSSASVFLSARTGSLVEDEANTTGLPGAVSL